MDLFEDQKRKFVLKTFREGFLEKRGHVIPNWKTRYFVMYEYQKTEVICYFLTRTDFWEGKALGIIELKDCAIGRTTKFKKRPYTMHIRAACGANHYIDCGSAQELELWLHEIQKVTIRYVTPVITEVKVEDPVEPVQDESSPVCIVYKPNRIFSVEMLAEDLQKAMRVKRERSKRIWIVDNNDKDPKLTLQEAASFVFNVKRWRRNVFLGTLTENPTSNKVLVRRVPMVPDSIQELLTELDAQQNCQHKNVVDIKKFQLGSDCLWVAEEYLPLTLDNLLQSIPNLSEGAIAFICREVLEGLCCINDIGSRKQPNMRSDSILIDMDGNVKLCRTWEQIDTDCKINIKFNERRAWMIAPELFNTLTSAATPDPLRDSSGSDSLASPMGTVWAFGMLILQMLDYTTFTTAKTFPASILTSSRLSSTLKDFLRHCFEDEPNRRSPPDVLSMHPFVMHAITQEEFSKEVRKAARLHQPPRLIDHVAEYIIKNHVPLYKTKFPPHLQNYLDRLQFRY